MIDKSIKQAVLLGNPYFSTLCQDALEEFAGVTQLRSFEKGEVIFWEGDPCLGLHIIRKGSIKLFKNSPSGRELIVKVFEEGATFNEVPAFDDGTNPVNAAALEDCEIWIVPGETLRMAMTHYPEMCRAVVGNLTANLRMLVRLVDELSFYQVTNRLARLLVSLTTEQLEGSPQQRITQDQLAARLGTVREVVARSLRELERSGAIEINNRKIAIVSTDVLENWAQTLTG